MPGAIDSKMENLNIENCSVFLNYLEPSESKVLRIDSIRKFLRQSAGVLEKLIGTEQSKSFNVVQIQKAVDVDSERIVNAGSFCVYIDNMDADFFWNFIQVDQGLLYQ
uniref:Uncharacterized protein n=1 Tax=Caenorhabditis tropicalis TaxID=1561998 RepID=A0A1I7TAR9_9PELO